MEPFDEKDKRIAKEIADSHRRRSERDANDKAVEKAAEIIAYATATMIIVIFAAITAAIIRFVFSL